MRSPTRPVSAIWIWCGPRTPAPASRPESKPSSAGGGWQRPSRAGATTLAELTASGRPAILVPLPTATDDHQRKNAEVLGRAGAALVIDERELDGARLADAIAGLIADPAKRQRMAEVARTLARPDAAARIADRVEQLGRGER